MNETKTFMRIMQFIGVVLLALFCLLICAPSEKRPQFVRETLKDYKIHYGLDLEGGSELLYEVNPGEIDPTRTADGVIDDTIGIISQRIFESGIVKEPRVQKQDSDRILIQLPGLNKEDTNKIKQEIQRLGKLEFRLLAGPNIWDGKTQEKERETFDRKRRLGGDILKTYEEKLSREGYGWYPDKDSNEYHLLWIKDPYNITGQKFSSFYYDSLNQSIDFVLKDSGKGAFGELTKKYTGEVLTIVFNEKVVARPSINGPIPQGQGLIQGFSRTEYDALLTMLRSGSLEIQPELLHENTIGPSLGEDSIRLGISAGVLGLTCVLGFMIIYYMAAGVVASIALLLNLLIVFAILVISRETLTLPGIAGLVLTVGMSIDANIIIFERIREEKNKRYEEKEAEEGEKKKSFTKQEIMGNLERGYQKALSTILDANITTLITAIILYYIATGAVQGFAFTMLWGILASFFTAIFITRLLLSLGIDLGIVRQITMLEALKRPSFNIVSKMPIGKVFSIILIILGMAIFTSKGERNYGLDLKGGILAQISLNESLQTKDVRGRFAKEEIGKMLSESPEVQHIVSRYKDGSSKKGWFEFSIRLPSQNEDKIAEINSQLSDISRETRRKLVFLRDLESRSVAFRAEEKSYLRLVRQLERDNAPQDQIKKAKEEHKNFKKQADEVEKELAVLEKEMTAIKESRSLLIAEKNRQSGVETLREIIEKEFGKELSPRSFGEIKKITKGKHRGAYQLSVNLQSPTPRAIIEKAVKEISDFSQAVVAVKSYDLALEAGEEVSEKDIAELLRKHFQLSRPSLDPKPFEKLVQVEGMWTVPILFGEAAPIETVQEAIEKCGFTKSKLLVTGYRADDLDSKKEYLTTFDVIIKSPAYTGLSLEEAKAKMELQIRDKFAQTSYEYKGEESQVYLSDPFPRFSQISGVVAKAQKSKAFQAIFLSLFLILCYIGFRFPNGWRFGFGAVVALAHDVLITLGAIAVFDSLGLVDVKIGLPVIAALLTIVGYSLNDTIVIFDRIRENQKKYEVWDRLSIEKVTEVYNESINQTLSRTILTSLTTLFVVGVIFFLNQGRGSVMEGFSFALIVGVIVGTYSSIFVASAVVLKLECKNRT